MIELTALPLSPALSATRPAGLALSTTSDFALALADLAGSTPAPTLSDAGVARLPTPAIPGQILAAPGNILPDAPAEAVASVVTAPALPVRAPTIDVRSLRVVAGNAPATVVTAPQVPVSPDATVPAAATLPIDAGHTPLGGDTPPVTETVVAPTLDTPKPAKPRTRRADQPVVALRPDVPAPALTIEVTQVSDEHPAPDTAADDGASPEPRDQAAPKSAPVEPQLVATQTAPVLATPIAIAAPEEPTKARTRATAAPIAAGQLPATSRTDPAPAPTATAPTKAVDAAQSRAAPRVPQSATASLAASAATSSETPSATHAPTVAPPAVTAPVATSIPADSPPIVAPPPHFTRTRAVESSASPVGAATRDRRVATEAPTTIDTAANIAAAAIVAPQTTAAPSVPTAISVAATPVPDVEIATVTPVPSKPIAPTTTATTRIDQLLASRPATHSPATTRAAPDSAEAAAPVAAAPEDRPTATVAPAPLVQPVSIAPTAVAASAPVATTVTSEPRSSAPAATSERPESARNTTTTAAKPSATSALQPQRDIQPAARMFAQAMFAATPAAERDEAPSDALPIALLGGTGPTAPTTTPIAVHAAAAADRAALDMTRADWMTSMIDRIETIRDESGGIAETRVKLAPDALGNVDVSLRRDDSGQIRVDITADTAQARTILSDAAPRLADMAEARGLKLGGASVDAGGPNGGGTFADSGRREAQQSPTATPRRPASAANDAGTDTTHTKDTRLA